MEFIYSLNPLSTQAGLCLGLSRCFIEALSVPMWSFSFESTVSGGGSKLKKKIAYTWRLYQSNQTRYSTTPPGWSLSELDRGTFSENVQPNSKPVPHPPFQISKLIWYSWFKRLERDQRTKPVNQEAKKINNWFSSTKHQPLHSNWKSTRPKGNGSRDPFGCEPTVPLYLVGREKLPSGYERNHSCRSFEMLPVVAVYLCG